MNRILLAVLLLVGLATAARAEELRVRENHSVAIDLAGATAAFAVDPDIAEVSIVNGVVQIRGVRSGATTITVVTAQSAATWRLVVLAAPAPTLTLFGSASAPRRNTIDTFYDSETGRFTTSFDSTGGSPRRSFYINATAVTHDRDTPGYARTSLPSVSLGLIRDGRQITLLDQRVQGTELQRGSRTIRGVHYQSSKTEVHAGWLTTLLYRSFLVAPETSARIVSVLRKLTFGKVLVAPRLTWYSAEPGAQSASGVAPAIQVRNATPASGWQLGADVGYKDGVAAAGQVAFDSRRHHLLVRGDHLPESFPNPLGGPLPGSSLRGELASRLTPRFSILQTLDAVRHLVMGSVQRTGTATSELRFGLSSRWSLSAGANVNGFEDEHRRVTGVSVPLRADWRGGRSGFSGVVRYEQHSANNNGGFGGALNGSISPGNFSFTGAADYQRDAATLDLMFRDSPDLQRIFTELGLTIRTPQELSQLLRGGQFPELNRYFAGLNPSVSPWRLQLRADAGWQSPARGSAVRLSVMADRRGSTTTIREHLLSAVTYVQRVAENLDLTGGATWWTNRTAGDSRAKWSYNAGLRARFNGMPDLGSFRRHEIEGRVFLDDNAAGLSAANGPPMPGVRVRLETGEETVSGPDGRFVFRGVRGGVHGIEAVLPEAPGMRFTTPSITHVSSGQKALFGLGRLPARVVGHVLDDVGTGVGGVHVLLTCGGMHAKATTETSGRFTLSGPEGTCTVVADVATLPAGFAAGREEPRRTVSLTAEKPAGADFHITALRSITGLVTPASDSAATVLLVETQAVAHPDSRGRFVFRNLRPGRYTVSVHNGNEVIERQVEVPVGPAVVNADLRNPNRR